LDVFINDSLQSILEKYECLNEYAIFLSVYGYNDGKIILRDANPSGKTNYLDLNG
jgi:hypothetical protein